MVDQIAVVRFQTRSGAGTQDITSPAITETFKAAIFLWSRSSSDGTDNAHAGIGMGFCTANPNSVKANGASFALAEDAVTSTPNTGMMFDDESCIVAGSLAGLLFTRTIDASFSSAISGGVRLSFATATEQTEMVAILFAGIADSHIDEIDSSTAGASTEACSATAGGSFEPNLIVFLPTDQPGGSSEAEAETQAGLGFAVNDVALTQKFAFENWDDAVEPSDADGVVRSDTAFGWLDFATRALFRGTVTDFVATGFEHRAVVGNTRARYLALKFSEATTRIGIANKAISGSTGNQDFTGFGFTPSVVLGMSTLLAAEDTLTDGATAATFGYFVTGDDLSRAYTAHHEEGVTASVGTPSNAGSRQEDVALLTYNHQGTVAQRATWVGGIADGFRLNFTTATTGYMTVLAIGTTPFVPDVESVTISDSGAVVVTTGLLEASESVLISDGFVLDVTSLVDNGTGDPLGVTAQAGAARGSTVQAGSLLGRTSG